MEIPNLEEAIAGDIKKKKRTLSQNDKMWGVLGDVALQVCWCGDYYTKDEWKQIFTAALRKQKVAPGIDGGKVILGYPTSKLTKGEMANLIDLIYAFGIQQGVEWTEDDEY